MADETDKFNKFESSETYKPLRDALNTFATALVTTLADFSKRVDHAEDFKTKFLLADAMIRIYDAIASAKRVHDATVSSATFDGTFGPNLIVPVPITLVETAMISNRIVSFILDDTHFGTGILVGKRHVLTAAHLFFDEHGELIDQTRAARITVEAHTTYLGNILMEGPRRTRKLADRDTLDGWLIDPKVHIHETTDESGQTETHYFATREVRDLDFAIVKLDDSLDEEIGFGVWRRWVNIPTADEAEVLATNLGVRVFQFLDRKELLVSSGHVHDVTSRGYRIRHTASTADSASGAFMGNDEFKLVAVHLAGSASGELPRFNRALPIRRVAEEIDRLRADGTRARDALND